MFVLCIIVNEVAQRMEIWWNWTQIVINRKTKFLLWWCDASIFL